jgi:hypothetical protein
MYDLTVRKQSDYCGGSDDPFFNVSRVERSGICSTPVGLLTRINDKMARIESFIKNGELKVSDETVEDSIQDICNYLIMLGIYLTKDSIEKNRYEGLK